MVNNENAKKNLWEACQIILNAFNSIITIVIKSNFSGTFHVHQVIQRDTYCH